MLPAARHLLDTEARAIARASQRLGADFERAARLILESEGRVVTTGMGKSGYVARKLAATLCATGTPASFLHPAEAVHGDLGLVQSADVVILISKSGATEELVRLMPRLQQSGVPCIGILGNLESPLARGCQAVLDAGVEQEGDPHNLVPAASAIVAAALGDALAVALMQARQFGPDDFGVFHPAGQLGRNLRLHVRDAMHTGDDVAWVTPESALRDVVIAMTRRSLGAACVLTASGTLAGLITDGDVRRALESHDDIRGLKAADLMTANPLTVRPEATLREALVLMESRTRQLPLLPVVDADGRALGLLRLHDVYQAGLGRSS
ncbi:KpsF/GutQ family sugar-phosphate isomerase [uncultured Paludibaculum sp.]|uniref:KpsF/GutQ family sugar-phosphate isomerase n=1 Tax=uncultured Paludibaculum sp. TaxID=1765020 RepID=UPI002AAC4C70|nr:KpsF/GutQ family sugar-phosphate isomerase [uncultured Paludibaculum sp.]